MRALGKRSPEKQPSRRGVAAAEFALILPLLVTIVFGCVDFGRFAHSYIAVTNAARAGAGFASFNPYTSTTQSTWQSQVTQAVIDEMSQMNGFNSSNLTVSTPVVTTDANGLKRVRVDVSYPFQTIVTWPAIPKQVTLRRAVEMRMIR